MEGLRLRACDLAYDASVYELAALEHILILHCLLIYAFTMWMIWKKYRAFSVGHCLTNIECFCGVVLCKCLLQCLTILKTKRNFLHI